MRSLHFLSREEQERLAYMNNDPAHPLYAQLADSEEVFGLIDDAVEHIDEASSQYPAEDCLQDLIDHAHAMAQGRVTKAEVLELVAMMEERQSELAHDGEYGRDELRKATQELNEGVL